MQPGAPDASGRRRPEPAPGTEFTIPCDRVLLAIGQGPELDWLAQAGNEGPEATKQKRLKADAVTFSTGRPGVFATGDVRIGAATVVEAIAEGRRAAYAVDAFLKGMDLDAIRTRQTLAEPQPEFLSIVPFTAEIKEPRYRLKALPAEERNHSYIEYELPYTPEAAMAESTRCLQCTCEAIGFCDLRRLGIEYGTDAQDARAGDTTRAPATGRVTENRFTGINHDYIRDDSHAFILREPSRCIDCGRCANVCAEVVGAACYDFMRIGFDTLVTTPLDMSLNDTPCVSCGRCAETCPTGALMPKPRVLREVRGRREPLHPVRHLRRCLPVRRPARRRRLRARPHGPRRAEHRPHGARRDRPRDRGHVHPARARLGDPGRGRGPDHRQEPDAADAAADDRRDPDAGRQRARGERPRRARPRGRRGARSGRPRVGRTVRSKIVPILLALIVMGAVLGIAALMLVLLGQDWEDALFWILAAVMLGAALLVVTMRDIIRCGLAMIVSFLALAGIYVLIGAPLLGAAQVIVYIGAISVLILFAIMLTQTKDAPSRLVFQTQAVPAAIAAVIVAVLIALAVSATDWAELTERVRLATNTMSLVLFDQFVFPFEIVSVLLLAAVIGGVFLAKREPGGPS